VRGAAWWSTWCKRAAASAWATRSGPTRCRTTGVDTVEANLQLGFDADHRSYDLAAAILADLGVGSVRLMTNNPAKLAGLAAAGVRVAAHEPHWVDAGAQAADYLEVKKDRMGHLAMTTLSDDPGSSDAMATVIDPALTATTSCRTGSTAPVQGCELDGNDVLVKIEHPDPRLPAGRAARADRAHRGGAQGRPAPAR
jgi:hypothetical protein